MSNIKACMAILLFCVLVGCSNDKEPSVDNPPAPDKENANNKSKKTDANKTDKPVKPHMEPHFVAKHIYHPTGEFFMKKGSPFDGNEWISATLSIEARGMDAKSDNSTSELVQKVKRVRIFRLPTAWKNDSVVTLTNPPFVLKYRVYAPQAVRVELDLGNKRIEVRSGIIDVHNEKKRVQYFESDQLPKGETERLRMNESFLKE